MSIPTGIAPLLAPTGRLRVAINLSNAVLAWRHPTTGEIGGVSMVLAGALAQRLGVALDTIPMQPTDAAIDALASGDVDLAFLAIDPGRAGRLAYTAPYAVIEGTYLCKKELSLASAELADQAHLRIGVARGSAHDLFLSRAVGKAVLLRSGGLPDSMERLARGEIDLIAGVRQTLELQAVQAPGLRVLPGRFTEIQQAIGIARGREAALDFLNAFLQEVASSGAIAAALAERPG